MSTEVKENNVIPRTVRAQPLKTRFNVPAGWASDTPIDVIYHFDVFYREPLLHEHVPRGVGIIDAPFSSHMDCTYDEPTFVREAQRRSVEEERGEVLN